MLVIVFELRVYSVQRWFGSIGLRLRLQSYRAYRLSSQRTIPETREILGTSGFNHKPSRSHCAWLFAGGALYASQSEVTIEGCAYFASNYAYDGGEKGKKQQ